MNWWQAIILGLVEGITEYLPVSSTGHLIITTELMRFGEEIRPHVDDYTIVIQGGAILAVLGLYRQRVVQMIRGLMGKDEAGRRLAVNIIIAFLPAPIIGLQIEDWIDANLFSTWPVITMLVLGGVWMIWIDRWRRRKLAAHENESDTRAPEHEPSASARRRLDGTLDDLTWKGALGIGLFQCVAMIPGTSRSMMTIAGGTVLGLRPRDAAEFSFLLGLPTLGAACLWRLGNNMYDAHQAGEENMFQALGATPIIIGVAVSFVSAMLAVKWLVGFLNTHGLAPFGYYRIALSVLLGSLVLGGLVQVGTAPMEGAHGDVPAAAEALDAAGELTGADATDDLDPGDASDAQEADADAEASDAPE